MTTTTLNIGDRVAIYTDHKAEHYRAQYGLPAYTRPAMRIVRLGTVVEIGTAGKYAGRVRVRWSGDYNITTGYTRHDGKRTWMAAGKLVVSPVEC